MVVVADDVRAKVDVVVGGGRAFDDQCAEHAVAVLVGEVAMVPGRSVLSDVEAVCFHVSWGNGALGDPVGAVLVALAELADAMPVDRCPG
jgi:hypothetical protein